MSRLKDEVGHRFGHLTVVKRVPRPRGHRPRGYWLCQCDCGEETVVSGKSLRSGHTKSCGCLAPRLVNEVGHQYGRLTVVSRGTTPKGTTKAHWLCHCECGRPTVVGGYCLRSGLTRSCGCLSRDLALGRPPANRQPDGKAAAYALYMGYVKAAKKRGLEFALSQEEFLLIAQAPCHYCGAPPRDYNPSQCNGSVRSSGIDRKDSQVGYVQGNCVPCCKNCNYAKRSLPYEAFRKLVRKVYDHWASPAEELP